MIKKQGYFANGRFVETSLKPDGRAADWYDFSDFLGRKLQGYFETNGNNVQFYEGNFDPLTGSPAPLYDFTQPTHSKSIPVLQSPIIKTVNPSLQNQYDVLTPTLHLCSAKSRTFTFFLAVLSLITMTCGLHHFYLGNNRRGLLYFIVGWGSFMFGILFRSVLGIAAFFITFIMITIVIVECCIIVVMTLFSTKRNFEQRFIIETPSNICYY